MDLCYRQYDRKLTPSEQAAFDLLSAEETHNALVRNGGFTMPRHNASKVRIDKLRAAFWRAMDTGEPVPGVPA